MEVARDQYEEINGSGASAPEPIRVTRVKRKKVGSLVCCIHAPTVLLNIISLLAQVFIGKTFQELEDHSGVRTGVEDA